ncbi:MULTISPECIES: tyrosine-type recombinase/integrase [Streptomyces]|uniref:Integrase n=2 Tax=root TaxID=1 RepID=F2R6C6_STRVP|nr:site-specific integrase [Streptomyces venezuelae]YP_010754244.1 integrase [Streptomyces phage Chymera]AMS01591.1 integrase [Streptomyces phage Chymera]APE22057.1 site-specific integrase [Streptomyces venezuelae]QER99446.1 site-specific integrase [Streptomyces venezuelae ATCC 10712]CCA56177.1 Integrase [Streptomyces venezuelae ATCC 10712]
MASVHPRKNRAGEITSYQVKWRDAARRPGDPQWATEKFDGDDEGKASADIFKQAVDEAGQRWPAGWIKGRGYIVPEEAGDDGGDAQYRFRAYATKVIELKTGIEEQYRKDCLRELEMYIFPTFGECDVRSVGHFSSDTIRGWVRVLEQTKVRKGRGPLNRMMSPKTIRNLHGLLSSILNEAVRAEPPLRARNPCERTNLPRRDDGGTGPEDEDIEFLTPQEVAAIRERLTIRQDQLMVEVKYGTGLRYSELTALAPYCLLDSDPARVRLQVHRAWKKDGEGGYYVGMPKSKRSRRTIRVSKSVIEALNELRRTEELDDDSLFFTGDQGQRLHYSTFYDRWQRAIRKAKEDGVLPIYKHPTPHDLRHSHAAALISAGHSPTYVQRRLGHESIKTTSDLYGHLLPETDDDAMETIETTLQGARPALRAVG